jgi:hypothetical protein
VKDVMTVQSMSTWLRFARFAGFPAGYRDE